MQAIILKKIPTREWDQLVVCYTQDFGKQTYVAKSLSRPTSKQASHLDVLNLVDFNLVSKPLALRSLGEGGIITSAYSLETFVHLKQSLPAISVNSPVAKMTIATGDRALVRVQALHEVSSPFLAMNGDK